MVKKNWRCTYKRLGHFWFSQKCMNLESRCWYRNIIYFLRNLYSAQMGPEALTIPPHYTKTLRWLAIFLKPSPQIMCLKKQYGFTEIWVQSLRSMGSECQWAKQRVAKMGFGGFETQAPGPLWSKQSYSQKVLSIKSPRLCCPTRIKRLPWEIKQ